MSPAAARAATRATREATGFSAREAKRAATRTTVAAPARRLHPAASPRGAAAAIPHPARRPRSAAQARPRQGRLSFGVLGIGVAGVLLAGVVAVNVLVLRQNVQLDQQTHARTRLRAENASLASQVSAAVAASRIEGLAERSLGLVPAAPEQTTYLDLGRRK